MEASEGARARRGPLPAWLVIPLIVPVALVAIPVGVAILVLRFAAAVVLLMVVWTVWCPRGRYALVVYSNSPIWQDYFEKEVLPAIGSRGAVLNWSERKGWRRYSLPVILFRMFGGTEEFNPLVVVFPPLAWPRRFRFFRPFKAFKRGRPEEVEDQRRAALRLLDALEPRPE